MWTTIAWLIAQGVTLFRELVRRAELARAHEVGREEGRHEEREAEDRRRDERAARADAAADRMRDDDWDAVVADPRNRARHGLPREPSG